MTLKAPIRSQRTKRWITKARVLQAFLVLALYVWLIHEVKDSYSVTKQNSENENDEVSKIAVLRGIEVLKLGRKNLEPKENSKFLLKENEMEGDEIVKEDDGEGEESMEDVIDEDEDTIEKENEIEEERNDEGSASTED